MSVNPEPAIKSYFFGKGYRDLWGTIKESWLLNWNSAKTYWNKKDFDGFWISCLSLAYISAAFAVVLFGTTFFSIISLLHITILFTFFLLVYIAFTIVWFVERTFLLFRGFFVSCPSCHKKVSLPEYFCDNCKAVHTRLVPNNYGILTHRCQCGQKLPATFFVNRGRLQSRCPEKDCKELLHRDHSETKKIFIPIMGGVSAGKSAFMFSVVQKIIDQKATEMGYKTEFVSSNTEADYKKVVYQFENGKRLGKTSVAIPPAFNLALKKKEKTEWLLYFYDPSGENYENIDDLNTHRFNEYLNGMVLIVDPFSIPMVRRDYERELSKEWSSINPSELPIADVLSRLLLTMEQSFNLEPTKKIKKPLAVVISKTDAFDLEDIIGEAAVDRALHKSKNKMERSVARNKVIKHKLTEWDEADLIQTLENRFSSVNYYSCSALGRIPDSSDKAFSPHYVFLPIQWILNSVSKRSFKL